MTYGVEFCRHVLSVREKEGLSFTETAARFSVGVASLTRWTRQVEPKLYDRRKGLKVDLEKVAQDVRDHPNDDQYERAALFWQTGSEC